MSSGSGAQSGPPQSAAQAAWRASPVKISFRSLRSSALLFHDSFLLGGCNASTFIAGNLRLQNTTIFPQLMFRGNVLPVPGLRGSVALERLALKCMRICRGPRRTGKWWGGGPTPAAVGESCEAALGGRVWGRQVGWSVGRTPSLGSPEPDPHVQESGQRRVAAKEELGHKWARYKWSSAFLKSGRGCVPHNIQKNSLKMGFQLQSVKRNSKMFKRKCRRISFSP